MARLETATFCLLFVFSLALNVKAYIFISRIEMFMLTVLNVLRIFLIVARQLEVLEQRCRLMLDVILSLHSITIWVASIWLVAFSWNVSNQEEPARQQWEKLFMLLMLIVTNIMFSAMWWGIQAENVFDRQEDHGDHSRSTVRFTSVPRATSRAVTSFMLLDGMTECAGSLCAICLDEFSPGGIVGRLPCNHVFHDECVRMWLKSKQCAALCPMRCPLGPRPIRKPNRSEISAVVHGSESGNDLQV